MLAAKRQMLAFEPPHFGPGATLGGCIAAGLSGPRRAYTGAVRDYVLGVRMIDGKGDVLNFGGQVMKNVAGYDVSRLMTGSLGTLGLLLDVSLKVLPLPVEELSLRFDMAEREAIDAMNRWAAQPLSLSATCHHDGVLTVRLSGAAAAVRSVRQKLGGEVVADADIFWRSVREQQHAFFQTDAGEKAALWRLSLPSTAAAPDCAGTAIDRVGRRPALAGERCAGCRYPPGSDCARRTGDRCFAALHPMPSRSIRCRHPLLRAASAFEAVLRSARHLQPRPHVPGVLTPCKPILSIHSNTLPTARRRNPSCAPACIAVSAPLPAPLINCWATNWTVRADAST